MFATLKNDDDRRFMFVLLAVSAALRFFYLGHQSLWVDEINTVNVATPSDGYTIWQLTRANLHGPLPTFLLYLWKSFADSDAWLRVPSAVAGIAGVLTAFLWMRRWLGAPVARVAAILLAVNPLHIHYSQEVRNYAFVFLFATLAGYLMERWFEKGKNRGLIAWGALIACAVLSNFNAAFFFAAQSVIYFLRMKVRKGSIRPWLLVCIVAIVFTAPWIHRVYRVIDLHKLVTPVMPGQVEPLERLRGETTVTPASIPYTLYAYSVGFTLGPTMRELHENARMLTVVGRHRIAVLSVAILFGSLFLVGLFAALRRRHPWGELLVHLVLPIVAVIALNWQNAKAFNVRYVLLALPAFLAFVATAITVLPRYARMVSVTGVGALTLLSISNYYFNGDYAREDVRAATRYADAHMDADACIFAPTVWQVVEWYHRGPQPLQTVFRIGLPAQRFEELLDDAFAGCNTMWYVRARPWVLDWDNHIFDRVNAAYDVSERVEFDGVTLFHLTRKK